MQAIEFIAEAEDGTIKIPKKHLKNLNKEFRVIILIDGVPKESKTKKKHLNALKIKTKGFSFSRDEANER